MAVTLVVGVSVGSALVAQQRWYELYDEAIKHVQQRQWAEAEAKLLQARKRQASGRRVLRYGMIYDTFFPEYYLGVVYLETNRPKEALQQFELARKAGLNERDAAFRQITKLEENANARIAVASGPKPSPPPPRGPETPTPTRPTTPETPRGEPPPVPPPVNYRQEFATRLTQARAQLNGGDYTAAQRLATEGRDLADKHNLTAERPQADALLIEINAARLSARVENALTRRDSVAARREFNELVAAAPNLSVAPLRTRVEQLEREIRGAQLQRDAMKAFFGGNYQQSLSLLTQAEQLAPLPARGHFYRACSIAGQAAESRQDPSTDPQLKQARQSYQLAARAPAEYQRDVRYISPKIRALLGIR